LLIVAYIVPGLHVDSITTALIAALIIGLVNGTLGMLLKVVTFPFALLTLGLVYLIINALMLLLATKLVDGFRIDGFLAAFIGAILLSVVNAILRAVLKPSDK
jgi:putative membrane protein